MSQLVSWKLSAISVMWLTVQDRHTVSCRSGAGTTLSSFPFSGRRFTPSLPYQISVRAPVKSPKRPWRFREIGSRSRPSPPSLHNHKTSDYITRFCHCVPSHNTSPWKYRRQIHIVSALWRAPERQPFFPWQETELYPIICSTDLSVHCPKTNATN